MVVPINGNLKVNNSEQSGIERTLRRIYELLFVSNILVMYLLIKVKLVATVVELLMGVLMVTCLISRHKKNIVIPYNTIWYGLFTIFCAFSAIWAQYFFHEITDNILRMVIVTVTITSISIYVDTEYDLERLIDLFVFSIFVIAVIELSVTPFEYWATGKLGSNFSLNNVNDISFWTSCAGAMSFYKAYINNKKPMYLLFLFFLIFSLLSSSRKAALISLIAPTIIIFLATYKKNYFLRIFCIILFSFFAFLIIMKNSTLYKAIGARVSSMLNFYFYGDYDGSLYKREYYIVIAKKMFAEAPVFGKGFGNFSKILNDNPVNSIIYYSTYSHNNYWQILSELGIIGFILYYSLYAMILLKLIKRVFIEKNRLCYLFLSFMIVLIIFEYGIVSEHSKHVQLVLALAYTSSYAKNTQQTL